MHVGFHQFWVATSRQEHCAWPMQVAGNTFQGMQERTLFEAGRAAGLSEDSKPGQLHSYWCYGGRCRTMCGVFSHRC